MDIDGKEKNPLIDKCFELDMNFDLLVHSMLNSLLTDVLSLDISIHVIFMFLLEG